MQFFFQYLYYTCVIALGSSSLGQNIAFIPAATNLDHDLHLTEILVKFYNIIGYITAFLGSVLLRPAMKFLGRRRTAFATGAIEVVSWILTGITSSNFYWLVFISRALFGFAFGLGGAVCSMYIMELSPDEYRGKLGVFHQIFIGIGGLTTTIIGGYCSWKSLCFFLKQ